MDGLESSKQRIANAVSQLLCNRVLNFHLSKSVSPLWVHLRHLWHHTGIPIFGHTTYIGVVPWLAHVGSIFGAHKYECIWEANSARFLCVLLVISTQHLNRYVSDSKILKWVEFPFLNGHILHILTTHKRWNMLSYRKEWVSCSLCRSFQWCCCVPHSCTFRPGLMSTC